MELKGVGVRGQTCFRIGRSTLDHIFTLCILIEQEIFVRQCLYFCFVDFKKAFYKVPRDKPWACLQRPGVPPHLQHVIRAMYIVVYAKV